jgi:hypothetical protein
MLSQNVFSATIFVSRIEVRLRKKYWWEVSLGRNAGTGSGRCRGLIPN